MILLSLSIIGFILSIILLYFNARKFPASIYLGALFFLISLYSIIQWILYYSNSPALVGIFYSNFAFLAFLIVPSNYWYIRSILTDDHRLKKRDYWHLVPALIAMVTSIPYMFTPWAEKTRVATEIINDLHYLMIIKPTAIHKLIPNEFIYLGRDVLVMTRAIVLDDPDLVYAASRVQLIAGIGAYLENQLDMFCVAIIVFICSLCDIIAGMITIILPTRLLFQKH